MTATLTRTESRARAGGPGPRTPDSVSEPQPACGAGYACTHAHLARQSREAPPESYGAGVAQCLPHSASHADQRRTKGCLTALTYGPCMSPPPRFYEAVCGPYCGAAIDRLLCARGARGAPYAARVMVSLVQSKFPAFAQ